VPDGSHVEVIAFFVQEHWRMWMLLKTTAALITGAGSCAPLQGCLSPSSSRLTQHASIVNRYARQEGCTTVIHVMSRAGSISDRLDPDGANQVTADHTKPGIAAGGKCLQLCHGA